MTVTVPWWLLPAITALAILVGWLIAEVTRHRPATADPGPGRQAAASPTPLPRAGQFTTEPMSLWSEHRAILDGHEREIRQMIDAAPKATLGYDPKQFYWEGPF